MWSFQLEKIMGKVEGEINFARGFCTNIAKGSNFDQKEELEFAWS